MVCAKVRAESILYSNEPITTEMLTKYPSIRPFVLHRALKDCAQKLRVHFVNCETEGVFMEMQTTWSFGKGVVSVDISSQTALGGAVDPSSWVSACTAQTSALRCWRPFLGWLLETTPHKLSVAPHHFLAEWSNTNVEHVWLRAFEMTCIVQDPVGWKSKESTYEGAAKVVVGDDAVASAVEPYAGSVEVFQLIHEGMLSHIPHDCWDLLHGTLEVSPCTWYAEKEGGVFNISFNGFGGNEDMFEGERPETKVSKHDEDPFRDTVLNAIELCFAGATAQDSQESIDVRTLWNICRRSAYKEYREGKNWNVRVCTSEPIRFFLMVQYLTRHTEDFNWWEHIVGNRILQGIYCDEKDEREMRKQLYGSASENADSSTEREEEEDEDRIEEEEEEEEDATNHADTWNLGSVGFQWHPPRIIGRMPSCTHGNDCEDDDDLVFQ